MRRSLRRADDVAGLLPALTPAAVLLADDPDAAVRLLITALSARRALDSEAAAKQSLVRAATHRPRWAAEQVIESRASQGWADEDVALAGAWETLPLQDRAVVVGTPGCDPIHADTATRLRDAVGDRDAALQRERARTAALYRRPGSVPEPEPPLPEVPERLAGLAAGRPLPENAAETIRAAVDSMARARRRRGAQSAAGVVAAAVLVAVVPFLPRGPEAPKPTSVYAGPTRGSLAGDEDFLRAMRESDWGGAAAPRGPLRVIYAGDVPGDRWALVAAGGTPAEPATTAWFAGPANAPPEQMRLRSIHGLPDPAEPVSVTDPATGALVVVGAPGDQVRLSDRPEVRADGSISRYFRNVPTSRGVVALSLAPIPRATMSALRLQVTRDHRRLDVPLPTVTADPDAPRVDVLTSWLRPSPSSAEGDGVVAARLRAVLGQLGEPVGDTPVTALWSGDLPGPNDQPARLTVLAIPRPSGAAVVTTPYRYVADQAGRVGSSWCGTGVLPAGVPLERRVVVVECDLSDLGVERGISRFLVVVGPRTATSMRLLDASGAVLGEQPLADGAAVVRSPGDVAQVDVTTADGRTVSVLPLTSVDLSG